MINVIRECTSRIEVIGQHALVYIHLGQNDGHSRAGAIGFLDLRGFHPMDRMKGKVKAIREDFGWFKIEMEPKVYLEWMEKQKEAKQA